jgi:hypothetical protein
MWQEFFNANLEIARFASFTIVLFEQSLIFSFCGIPQIGHRE